MRKGAAANRQLAVGLLILIENRESLEMPSRLQGLLFQEMFLC